MTFPFRCDTSPEHDGPLPEACDLAVIGGGVIGICTALYAARAGLRVVVLEKGRVAAEQSSRNWGWIRVQGRDMAEIPVAQESQKLWQALEAECKGGLGVRQVGVTYLARTDAEMAGYEGWLSEARQFGVTSGVLGQAQTSELLGQAGARWIGALHTPTDFKAEPWLAVPLLARLARQSGVTLRERCAVRMLDMQAGRVTGVVTEKGRIRAEQVVLAGGAWSSLLLQRHRVHIPQLAVRSTALATEPLPQVANTAAADRRLAFRPRDDGGYTLAPSGYSELFFGRDLLRHLGIYLRLALKGDFDVHLRPPAPRHYPDALGTPRRWEGDRISPFERMRVLDPKPAADKVAELLRGFAQLYPQLGEVQLKRAWAGMIDVMPDVVPIVDHVAPLPGVILATGMSGHGFGAGPGFGRITADLALGREPGLDLSRFRFGRFAKRSPLQPGPSI